MWFLLRSVRFQKMINKLFTKKGDNWNWNWNWLWLPIRIRLKLIVLLRTFLVQNFINFGFWFRVFDFTGRDFWYLAFGVEFWGRITNRGCVYCIIIYSNLLRKPYQKRWKRLHSIQAKSNSIFFSTKKNRTNKKADWSISINYR